ncbi:MAG: acyltransferase [Lachnospiraceae bacterium]|nr:acyltransferase [Lachnospiraceae bacterium]
MKKAYNSEIGILRFAFALCIFGVHSYSKLSLPFFGDGNYAVEFFFFLSGYYLTEHVLEKRARSVSIGESCRDYLSKRFLGLLPLLILSILFGIAVRFLMQGGTLTKGDIVYTVGDLFLTQGFLLEGAYYPGVAWYLSVLFIGIALLYPVLAKWPSYFTRVFSIFLALFLYGYLSMSTGNLSGPGSVTGVFMKGTLRGIAGMSAGAFLYGSMDRVRKVGILRSRIARTVIRIICYGAVFAGMIFLEDSPYLYPLLVPYMIAVGLSLYREAGNAPANPAVERFARFLQAVSLPFYLFHWNTIQLGIWFRDRLSGGLSESLRMILPIAFSFVLAIILSVLYVFAEKAVRNALRKRRKA